MAYRQREIVTETDRQTETYRVTEREKDRQRQRQIVSYRQTDTER